MPKTKPEILGGRTPVYEVLRAGRRRVHRLLLAEGVRGRGRLQQALDLATSRGIACETASRAVLDRLAANHQGLAAEVDPYPYVAVEDILERARQAGEPPFVLVPGRAGAAGGGGVGGGPGEQPRRPPAGVGRVARPPRIGGRERGGRDAPVGARGLRRVAAPADAGERGLP